MEARREAVETFVGITGASQDVATRMLESNGGDLNAAINTFFNASDSAVTAPLQRQEPDYMDEDEAAPPPATAWGLPAFEPLRSLFGSGARSAPAPEPAAPFVTEPRDVRQVPIVWRDEPPPAPPAPISIQDVSGNDAFPQGVPGGIVDDDDSPTRPSGIPFPRRSPEDHFGPEIPNVPSVEYDVEEEMIQAAIEASRRDAERQDPAGAAAAAAVQAAAGNEDDDIARAVSLSLQTAEEEKLLRELSGDLNVAAPVPEDVRRTNPPSGSVGNGFSLSEAHEADEQPLVRRRSSRLNVPLPEQALTEVGVALPEDNQHAPSAPRPNGGHDEWGGISSEEQDEAIMLEAALFGAINHLPYDMQRAVRDQDAASRLPQPLSPTVVAQRMLREQQDDEYLASLAADREKELKAQQEAEVANEMEKQRREDEQKQSRAAEELERKLAAKADSLPPEPAQEDDSAVTILVRLPDGSRHGRRFKKSDTLQSLFDFIDVKRVVKPGTYRLVRQYPRRLFTHEEHSASFHSLGLSSKQEALFLESS